MGLEPWTIHEPSSLFSNPLPLSDSPGFDNNPALDHLTQNLKRGLVRVQSTRALRKIEGILVSQQVVRTHDLPSRHLWLSGLPNVPALELIRGLEMHGPIKRALVSLSKGCAFVDFKLAEDAISALIDIPNMKRRFASRSLLAGFGNYINLESPWLQNCRRAGFACVQGGPFRKWKYAWLFLSESTLYCGKLLQEPPRDIHMELSQWHLMSRGPLGLELFNPGENQALYLRFSSRSEKANWTKSLTRITAGYHVVRNAINNTTNDPFNNRPSHTVKHAAVLWQQSTSMRKAWKRRWCVLDGSSMTMSFFDIPRDAFVQGSDMGQADESGNLVPPTLAQIFSRSKKSLFGSSWLGSQASLLNLMQDSPKHDIRPSVVIDLRGIVAIRSVNIRPFGIELTGNIIQVCVAFFLCLSLFSFSFFLSLFFFTFYRKTQQERKIHNIKEISFYLFYSQKKNLTYFLYI